MKRFKITYVEGNCIKTIVIAGNSSNEVLIHFLLENRQVTDVKKIEEIA